MKTLKHSIIISSILFVSIISHAQVNIVVGEQEVNMSKGQQPAFVVEIPRAENGAIIKSWSKYIRKDTKSKVQKANGEIFIKEKQETKRMEIEKQEDIIGEVTRKLQEIK